MDQAQLAEYSTALTGGDVRLYSNVMVGLHVCMLLALMCRCKNGPAVMSLATGLCYIDIHVVITALLFALPCLPLFHLTEGWCRWPLHLLHGLLQGAWLWIWVLKSFTFDAVLYARYATAKRMCGIAAVLVLPPFAGGVFVAVTVGCADARACDVVSVITTGSHLVVLQWTIWLRTHSRDRRSCRADRWMPTALAILLSTMWDNYADTAGAYGGTMNTVFVELIESQPYEVHDVTGTPFVHRCCLYGTCKCWAPGPAAVSNAKDAVPARAYDGLLCLV
jgi:hypothetical protein